MAIEFWSGKRAPAPPAPASAPAFVEARPKRRLSRHYRLHAPQGVWTELRFQHAGGPARFELQGIRFRMDGGAARRRWWTRHTASPPQPFRLIHKDTVIAHADAGGADGRDWVIRTAWGEDYRLSRTEGGVRLFRDGADLGAILRRPGVRRGAFAQLAASVPAAVQVFAVWLALCRWESLPTGAG